MQVRHARKEIGEWRYGKEWNSKWKIRNRSGKLQSRSSDEVSYHQLRSMPLRLMLVNPHATKPIPPISAETVPERSDIAPTSHHHLQFSPPEASHYESANSTLAIRPVN